jgi:hypothetical protein
MTPAKEAIGKPVEKENNAIVVGAAFDVMKFCFLED